MTDIEWDKKARDFLRKLPESLARRIFKKVDNDVRNNVERFLETLVGINAYKIKIGNYRLFVDYYKARNLVVIRAIRHRKNAYKK